MNESFEMLPMLCEQYASYMDSSIVSVRIAHRDSAVYLKTIRHDFDDAENVRMDDLDFITFEDGSFSPAQHPDFNARVFLTLCEVSLANCSDLFTDSAVREIEAAQG